MRYLTILALALFATGLLALSASAWDEEQCEEVHYQHPDCDKYKTPTPGITVTLAPTETPEPTNTPEPSPTPRATNTPEPTPTETPECCDPTATPRPTQTPLPTSTPTPVVEVESIKPPPTGDGGLR